MGFFGKKKDEDAQQGDGAQAQTATKEKHEADHVDENGEKKPDVEKVGEVCEFC